MPVPEIRLNNTGALKFNEEQAIGCYAGQIWTSRNNTVIYITQLFATHMKVQVQFLGFATKQSETFLTYFHVSVQCNKNHKTD